jgi:hypothetical protein
MIEPAACERAAIIAATTVPATAIQRARMFITPPMPIESNIERTLRDK